jgi:phosphatidate cytidylyltransferase
MKTSGLALRVVSAVLAMSLLLAVGYYGGAAGLVVMSSIAILLGIAEYARMAFRDFNLPKEFTWLFSVVSIVLYGVLLYYRDNGLIWLSLASAGFVCLSLVLTRNAVANEKLLAALGMGIFGMVCVVAFPLYAVRLAQIEQGPVWFLFLMLVVFAGDTFAFFGGNFFGKHKLMPQISPNKTIEGSVTGLAGSCLVGCTYVTLAFPEIELWRVFIFCFVCGLVAQSGDLLMSLVKRVAQVKDSGAIMPGHGGVLDRLDGIYLAAPLVYAFAVWKT